MTSPRRTSLSVFALGAMLVLAGCTTTGDADEVDEAGNGAAGSQQTTESTPAPHTATAPDATDEAEGVREYDQEKFCAVGEPMLTLVPRSYVGSDEHVAQFAALVKVAPDELVDVASRLETFYRHSVSPADPDSQDWVNFPADIQADAETLVAGIKEHCGLT